MRIRAVLLGVMAMALVGPAAAESAKTAVGVADPGDGSNIALASATGDSATIFQSVLHVANDKDLVVDVSFEAGLFTRTLVKSQGGNKDTSSAFASVVVEVLVDGVSAMPGPVTFASRTQTLSAKFGGFYTECDDLDGNGITLDECTLEDEELELILETMGAHSFNFILPDLTAGNHVVTVNVRVADDGSAMTGEWEATAWVRKGTVVVEEVRLKQSNDLNL